MISLGSNPSRNQKYKPEPSPDLKTNLKPKSRPKKPKVKLGLKNSAMLQSYFDYIFVRRRKKVRLRPELSPKFLSTLGTNPAQTLTRPEKPGPTYNSGFNGAKLSKAKSYFGEVSYLSKKLAKRLFLLLFT